MSHFTTRASSRKVKPYQAPTMFADDRPEHTRHESSTIDGEMLGLVVAEDLNQPGWYGEVRQVFDFYRDKFVAARVTTYPDGPRCTCDVWTRWQSCEHSEELAALGHLPFGDPRPFPPRQPAAEPLEGGQSV